MELPTDWNTFPYPRSTQAIGHMFVSANKYDVLKIPSAVNLGDFNILINPNHPDFSKVEIIKTEKFPLDNRKFR